MSLLYYDFKSEYEMMFSAWVWVNFMNRDLFRA